MDKGKIIVEKIKKYKEKNGKLPNTLADVGIVENEKTESEFSYQKIDSLKFFVWIGISFEESKFYYSDSGQWENNFRKME